MLRVLNDKQLCAVTEKSGSIVTACPGSGKTMVLAYKVALCLKEFEADNSKRFVVALTFTNRAADEIHHRLELLDVITRSLWSGTIHSFCLDWILRPYAGYSDVTKHGFTVIDEYAREELLSNIKKDYGIGFFDQINTKKDRTGIINNQSLRKEKAAETYHEELKSNKLIDFDLILYLSFQLIQQYPEIPKRLSSVIGLICVDEYQDTQDLQYAIISEIVKHGEGKTNIFFVGDPDQAIYGSIGGVAKTCAEVQEEVGCLELKPLEINGNYRSCQRIIDFSRHFQLTDIEVTAIGSRSEEHGIITYHNNIHKDDVHILITKLIKASLAQGIPEHEICVIAPQWAMVIAIARKLIGQLPDVSFDAPGLSPLRKNRENFWYKLARLFLTEPLPKMFLTRIRWANEVIKDLEVLLGIYSDETNINARSVLRTVNSIHPDVNDGIDYLKQAFREFVIKLSIDYENNEGLRKQWEIFFAGAQQLRQTPEIPTDIESFRKLFRDRQGIVINTCHGVKGEEYETVIAYGLLRGILPNWAEITSSKAETVASKRMLYVISSRAKSKLHLIAEIGRQTRQGNSYEPNSLLAQIAFDYDSISLK